MPSGTLVFLPGIAGSELRYGTAFGAEVELWLNPIYLVGGGWGLLYLKAPSEAQPFLLGTQLIEGRALVAFYGLLLEFLRNQGWDVVTPLADWRKSYAHDFVRAYPVIADAAERGDVYILAHSRGGLLARRALAQLATDGLLGQVKRVIAMGTPHGGSLTAVQYLTQEAQFVKYCATLGSFVPGIPGILLRPELIASVICSWQSLYELMPNPAHGWIPADSVSPLYVNETWFPVNVPIKLEYLAGALAQWGTLPAIPPTVDWINVIGTGFQTAWRMPPFTHFGRPGYFSYSPFGDGVVHEQSAKVPGRKTITMPTAHDWLPNDGRLWPLLHDALLNGLADDVTITGASLGF